MRASPGTFLRLACAFLAASPVAATWDSPVSPSGRVLFDEGRPDTLWACGRDYKARFGPEGATFVPFLGAGAPAVFPLELAAPEVRSGGRAIALEREVAPTRQGSVVLYERGPLTELFRVEPHGIEHLFRVSAPPAGEELVLRVPFRTELRAREEAGGIELASELGGVRYGAVVVLDERGELARLAPRLVEDAIEIRIGPEVLARGHGALTIDPWITTFTIDATPNDDGAPDLAHDPSLERYAVVWERRFSATDVDVYGRLFDPDGSAVADFVVDATLAVTTQPLVAGVDAADRFLATYHAENPTPPLQPSVRGRTLDPSGGGVVVGAPVTLLTGVEHHALGGDAGGSPPFRYLVVGSRYDYGALDWRLVGTDGTPEPAQEISSTPDEWRFAPAVSETAVGAAGDVRRWALAYGVGGDFFSGVHAVLLTTDGTVAPGAWVTGDPVDRVAVSSLLESPAWDAPFLVTWIPPGATAIRGRLMRASSTAGATYWVSTSPIPPASVCTDSDGASFVVAYPELGVSGAQLTAATYDLDEGSGGDALVRTEEVAIALGSATEPALVSTRKLGGEHQRFGLAWQASGDLLGALYDTPGPGTGYCTGAPNSVGAGARIRAVGGRSLALGTFELAVEGCPPGTLGIFYLGLNPIEIPFGDGFRCIGGASRRIVPILSTDGAGSASLVLDFDLPYGAIVEPGPPGANYQFWYRDPAGGPANFNLSDALHVEHLP